MERIDEIEVKEDGHSRIEALNDIADERYGQTGSLDGLDAAAVAELEAFREHLERHREANNPDCRFCRERGKKFHGDPAAPPAQPTPNIESREAIEKGARSLWASFCDFSDAGEDAKVRWDEVPEDERKRLRNYFAFAVRAARGVEITAQTALYRDGSPVTAAHWGLPQIREAERAAYDRAVAEYVRWSGDSFARASLHFDPIRDREYPNASR